MSDMWISPAMLERLAGSLLHFVWQGAAIAVAAAVALRLLRHRSAECRYAVASAALFAMVVAPFLTFAFYAETGALTLQLLRNLNAVAKTASAAPAAGVEAWTQWIVFIWVVGVSVLLTRLAGGWFLSRRVLRFANAVITPTVVELLERARSGLNYYGKVRLLTGKHIGTPVVIGWVRPAILLPASALTGLNPGQLLAILAHELAHIRRHDFLINGVQRAVECVLFYHPAVWWISGRMRVERERCCDDLAVRVCGDRMVYVNALVALENTREPILALPTAGAGLTDRVRRLLGIQGANRDWQSAVAALVFAVILVSAGMWQPTLAGPATPPRASVPTPQVQTPPAQPTQTPRPSLNPPLNPLIAIATAQNLRASEPAQTQRVTQPPIAASREAARDRLGMLKVEYSAESFVKQAAEGDTIAVKTFLAAGMNINARNEKGSTALMAAAYSGQTETAQALLAAGADPNLTIPGIVSHSALSNAAGRGDIATMKVLIAAGAQVELKVLQQETALISAAYNGQRDAVLLLLDNKANIEARSSSRGTALVAAACEGKSEVARALLERGADARANNGTPPQTNSVLHCAAMRGDPQLMGLLLDKGADINAPGSNGYTPLARAIADTSSSASSDGRRAGALFLIERGADVNIVAGERNADFTSLWLAVSRRQIEIVRALLAKGADPNKMTRQDPPLITALRNVTPESVEIAMLLIDKGADVNATDRNGGMPVLLFAIDAKQPDVVRALLAKGADPNKPNSQNRTPLQTAVGSPEMMQMLINAGAKQ